MPTGDIRLMRSMTSFARWTGSISASADRRWGSSAGTSRPATMADTSCLVASSRGPQWARIPTGARRSSALRSSPPAAMSFGDLGEARDRGGAGPGARHRFEVERRADGILAREARAAAPRGGSRHFRSGGPAPWRSRLLSAAGARAAPGSAVSAAARSSAANATSCAAARLGPVGGRDQGRRRRLVRVRCGRCVVPHGPVRIGRRASVRARHARGGAARPSPPDAPPTSSTGAGTGTCRLERPEAGCGCSRPVARGRPASRGALLRPGSARRRSAIVERREQQQRSRRCRLAPSAWP